MKIALTIIISICSIHSVCCQNKSEEDVPEIILQAFQMKYPNQSDPEWELDMNENWEAQFEIDGEEYRADFTPKGEWIETENNIKTKNLPSAILKVIESTYSQYEISEVERVQSASKGLFFDVEFKQKGKNMDVEFREDGSIIK